MRVNIKQELDERKLYKAIEEYKTINYNRKPYLKMNSQTIIDLCCGYELKPKDIPATAGIVGTYEGVEFYIDNDIPYGEVEIR